MADDTRDPVPQDQAADGEEIRRPRRPRPKHDFPETQAGKLWKAFGNPDNPVNEMPGGMVNTAGGRPKEVTWRDAFDLGGIASKGPSLYKTPCARDSLLVGIGSGGAVGGLGFILRGTAGTWVTANYAVGSFAVAALSMYTWCQSRRREEAKGMALAVAGMKMLHEKKAREEAEEKAKAAEALAAAQKIREAEKSKPWYKVW